MKRYKEQVISYLEDAECEITIVLETLEAAANTIADEEIHDKKIEDIVNHTYDIVASAQSAVEKARLRCERR